MSVVTPVKMPKWGLSMQEGAIVDWWKQEGAEVAEGEDLVDIETSKITNVCESPVAGVLRKIVAQPGETLPVGALIGVVADADTPEADVDAFIADFQASYIPPEAGDESAEVLKLSTVDAGGRAIRFGRAGPEEGTPVVLIHGYSGDLNNWLFNIEALAAVAPVIAVDLPGHGGSSKDVGDGSLKTLADAIAAALDGLGVAEAHLVGHSLGAAVAARLAIDHTGLARSLILIAPAGLSETAVSEEFLSGVIDAQRARDLKPVMEMLLADPGMVTKDMVEDVLKFKRTDGVEEALSALRDRMVEGKDAATLRADLAAIPSALVIASKADGIVGAPDEAALPPGFRVVWIEGAGHMPHLEKASEVNNLLVEAIQAS
ncbi:MAG: acetoin dehydrogenase dihydrolipoyllysine-residue acetyltransferase subunit [Caulobacteraceae bacterium]|nr:acetoin dehydrogenase dihydrolipoyllysine-residue acetyltransferase subunit [Caulobacteraceae bacterium]